MAELFLSFLCAFEHIMFSVYNLRIILFKCEEYVEEPPLF